MINKKLEFRGIDVTDKFFTKASNTFSLAGRIVMIFFSSSFSEVKTEKEKDLTN